MPRSQPQQRTWTINAKSTEVVARATTIISRLQSLREYFHYIELPCLILMVSTLKGPAQKIAQRLVVDERYLTPELAAGFEEKIEPWLEACDPIFEKLEEWIQDASTNKRRIRTNFIGGIDYAKDQYIRVGIEIEEFLEDMRTVWNKLSSYTNCLLTCTSLVT